MAASTRLRSSSSRRPRRGIATADTTSTLSVIESQTVGVPYSTLSIVRGWTVPSLYGNRLSLGAYFSQSPAPLIRSAPSIRSPPTATSSTDSPGGDTVTVLRVGSRSIPIARIHVHPEFRGRRARCVRWRDRPRCRSRADRSHAGSLCHARGETFGHGARASRGHRRRRRAYVEFVNAEIGGKYWLPAFQRTEFQASFPIFGQTRPVFRLVSNIRNASIDESAESLIDTSFRPRITVTWASRDSVNAFADWERGLGTQSSSVHSDDFQDMAPDAWRPIGPPRINPFPTELGRMLRFNRVEGVFTGVAPSIDFRSVVPGLSVARTSGGHGPKKTVRGGAFVNISAERRSWGPALNDHSRTRTILVFR